ncbi:helix-turn-helix domain-containing protein [Fredinandcohnia salidurans]|uniref:Helix-turn-helix domain-containing protein n=1 Tax=Fredinandcohnia salidurans TaxID=2595041 RepID=A0ABW4MV41_9BACI
MKCVRGKLNIQVGERIRYLRTGKEISREELAYRANLHYNFLGKVERGEKGVSLESLASITRALNVSLEEFFRAIDPIEKSSVITDSEDKIRNLKVDKKEQIFKIVDIVVGMIEHK